MKRFMYFFLFIIPFGAFAQLTVVSTAPQNNATNVPLVTVLSITFSAPLDTVAFKGSDWGFSNAQGNGEDYFSADAKTIYHPMGLQANQAYFVSLFYARGKDGSTLSSPFVMHFTTGSAFPTLSVSGTVASGMTGISPQNAIAGLSTTPVNNGKPLFVAWTNVNADGTFSIPYVQNGVYWPIAAKDVDRDGSIDPDKGIDVVAFSDSIIVNNASLSNIALTFMTNKPYLLSEAVPVADSMARTLPADRSLRLIRGESVDTTGRSSRWNFYYMVSGNTTAMKVNIRSSGSEIQSANNENLFGYTYAREISNPLLAAASSVVLANVEAAGGRAYRNAPRADSLSLDIQMVLGDLTYEFGSRMVPDPSRSYWAVVYSLGVEREKNYTSYMNATFICDFTTGAVLTTTSVNDQPAAVPTSPMLAQNYPNPFNPSTRIEYQIAERAHVRLEIVDMLGRTVAVLVDEEQPAGSRAVQWNASGMASGMYFCRLTAGSFIDMKKMVLMK